MREVDELRPLTAGRLLEIWRKNRREAEEALEQTLLCNASILAECCFFEGEPVFESREAVLRELTGSQMEFLLRKLAEEGGTQKTENPAFDQTRFRALRGE